MVLPRRHHARARRRHGCIVGAAALCVLLYIFFYRSPYSSSPSYTPPMTPVKAKDDLFAGNPPRWRDPQRDLDAEYQDILRTMPALKSARPARLAFLIMAHGPTDVVMLQRLLPWLYSPDNFILVHIDRKSSDEDRAGVRDLIEGLDNVRMLEPALSVSWGGFSLTLTALYGLSVLVEWSEDWDYFINISASDFPLMTAVEMSTVMGTFIDSRVNFVAGSAMTERNRAELYVDDQAAVRSKSRILSTSIFDGVESNHLLSVPWRNVFTMLHKPHTFKFNIGLEVGLYRANTTRRAAQPFLQSKGVQVERPLPTLFTLFKGEFWVTLHRDFCEYLHESPDNIARSLQAYFAKFRISDESYFQTTLCHPSAPDAFPVYGDNLRLVNWPEFDPEMNWVLHPDPVEPQHVPKLMGSGALFARKFEYGTSDQAWKIIESILYLKGAHMQDRIARVLDRGKLARSVHGRKDFCKVPNDYDLAYILSHQKTKVELKSPKGHMRSRQRF